MTNSARIGVAHFTNIAHLETIVIDGLLSDDAAKATGRLKVDVGDQEVKNRRSTRTVPVPPGGSVSSYVPFYFAPRSPMLFKIWKGQVLTYSGGQEPLVYLVSSLQTLSTRGCELVITDGNAANEPTLFSNDLADAATFLDTEVLRSTLWNNTASDPDRMRRRMAECLVKDHVPFLAIEKVVTMNAEVSAAARSILATMGTLLEVETNPNWYYS